jgi:hypothetical protein
MWNWFERWTQRQQELEHGVDADLVRDNQRRRRLAWWSFGVVVLLVAIDTLFHLRGWFRDVVVLASIAFLVFGFVTAKWAQAESGFLSRPDRKEPPRLFKL